MARESVWDFAVNRIANIGTVFAKGRQQEEENIYRRQAREIQEDALRLQQQEADRRADAAIEERAQSQRVWDMINRATAAESGPAMDVSYSLGAPGLTVSARPQRPRPVINGLRMEVYDDMVRRGTLPQEYQTAVEYQTLTNPDGTESVIVRPKVAGPYTVTRNAQQDALRQQFFDLRAASEAHQIDESYFNRLDDLYKGVLGGTINAQGIQAFEQTYGRSTGYLNSDGSINHAAVALGQNTAQTFRLYSNAEKFGEFQSQLHNILDQNSPDYAKFVNPNFTPQTQEDIVRMAALSRRLNAFNSVVDVITETDSAVWKLLAANNVQGIVSGAMLPTLTAHYIGVMSPADAEARVRGIGAAIRYADSIGRDERAARTLYEHQEKKRLDRAYAAVSAVRSGPGIRRISAETDITDENITAARQTFNEFKLIYNSNEVMTNLSKVDANLYNRFISYMDSRNAGTLDNAADFNKLAQLSEEIRGIPGDNPFTYNAAQVRPVTTPATTVQTGGSALAPAPAAGTPAIPIYQALPSMLEPSATGPAIPASSIPEVPVSQQQRFGLSDVKTLQPQPGETAGRMFRTSPVPIPGAQGAFIQQAPLQDGGPSVYWYYVDPNTMEVPGVTVPSPAAPPAAAPAAPPAATAPAAPQRRTGTVVNVQPTHTLNIRANPNTTADIMGTAGPGVPFTIVGDSGDWYMVRMSDFSEGDDRIGYVSRQFIMEQGGAATPSPTPAPTPRPQPPSPATMKPVWDAIVRENPGMSEGDLRQVFMAAFSDAFGYSPSETLINSVIAGR